MAGKNDILATAGVDLSAFEAGIAKLTSRLDAVEKSGSRAADGVDKVAKSTNALKNIQVFDHVVSALGQIASGGGVAANAMKQLDERAAFNNFGGAADNMAKFGAVAGNTIDVFSRMPGRLGAIAAVGQIVATNITDQTQAYKAFSAEQKHVAHTTDAMIAKDVKYAETQKELAKLHLLYNQNDNRAIDAITEARKQNAVAFEEQAKKEKDAISDTTAGGSARLSMLDVETERLQKISDLKANLSGPGGKLSVGKEGMFSLGSAKINAEAEAKKKILSVSEAQEKSEVSLNQSASVRGVTMSDAIEAQTSYQTELNAQLKIAQGLFAANSGHVTSLQKALHESALAVDAINFAQEQNLTSAKGNNEALEKTITGDKSAVASAKEKAAYEIARNQAIKDGNDDLLGQVDIQHDLSTKQIGIDEKNEQTQKSLLRKKQQIGITQQDHLKDLDAELYAAQESLRISNDAGQQGPVINEQLKEAAHQKAKALVLGQLALKDQERQANLEKDAAVQQQAGNQKLTTLAQIRAQYEVQITQAIREGRIEVAKQLTAQKQIAELEAKIADFQKTPQQRQDELKEQQKHDQAQGTVISRQQDREARARELGGINAKEKKSLEDLKRGQTIGKSAKEIRDMAKEQGVSEKPMTPEEIDRTLGRSDSTNRTSKSREKQLGDFLEERAPAPADIAKIQKQDVGQMDVQKINLAMLQNAP